MFIRLRCEKFFIACATTNPATFLGLKANLSFAAAVATYSYEKRFCGFCCLFASLPTFLATKRLVIKAFFSIKLLFAGTENKFLSAVLANEYLILVHYFFPIPDITNNLVIIKFAGVGCIKKYSTPDNALFIIR